MKVVAFVGPAGTGKSYRAQKVAHDIGAEAIIDDGLLIKDSKVLAGRSAKNEKNRIQAVKRAIFSKDEHVEEVRSVIQNCAIQSILIIGTSDGMVKKIAERLSLPMPEEYVYIEDIATKRELSKAKHSRYNEGKHIIPVPTVALKPHYSGVLIEPFKEMFFKKKEERNVDKSIVRPSFSMYGKMFISDSALEDIVKITLQEVEEIKGIINISLRTSKMDKRNIIINIEVILLYGFVIKDIVRKAQQLVKECVSMMTAMSVLSVNISVRRLVMK